MKDTFHVMAQTLISPSPAQARQRGSLTRTRILALPEARWALTALVLFLGALAVDLLGAPAWVWGPLYAAAYLTGGWEPGWAGLKALKDKTLDVDLLMVVAALGAAAIGQYFDGALLIVIFATSGALEAIATARTADSIRGLLDLAPATATRLTLAGDEEVVAADSLAVGDTILVRPGERVGADGRVLSGSSDVDQATITGESMPATKAKGDEVFASTVIGNGALTVRVERDPSDSVIARIVKMVEEASQTKAPTQLFIEKVEQRYSIGMVIATVALFAIPLAFGADIESALLRAMTFMIVASPCAIVLATMPPLLSAMANAGRHGVLVKSAVVMERLAQIDAAVLDKTGTLTEGTPQLIDIRTLPESGMTDNQLLRLAAAAEHPSEHPLAQAIVEASRARALSLPHASDFTANPGLGVTATVDNRKVRIGAPARLFDGSVQQDELQRLVADTEAAGRTAVVVLIDGHAAGVLGIADSLRVDATEAVTALTSMTGPSPVLLTGDNKRAAARLSTEVGITDFRASLLPQDKVSIVKDMESAGHNVLVVGDGVNDAPALAAAHTSVAMGRAGSDLALETADAVVVRDELAAIPTAIKLSRAARRLVTQNLIIAATFITVLVAWDIFGHLPLPLGVAGHEGSTIIVALNGLRLLRENAWKRASDTDA